MPATLKDRLIALLVENKLLTKGKLDEALKIQAANKGDKKSIGDILVELGYVSRENLLEVLSAELGMPAIHLARYKVQPEALAVVPKKIAELHTLLPVSKFEKSLTVAMSDPRNMQALDDLKRLTGLEIRPLLASEKDIREAIEQYYGENVSQAIRDVMRDITFEGLEAGGPDLKETSAQELLKLTEEQPVVKLTNSILSEAVRLKSSDIFVEPEETTLRVRFRVDGMLQEGIVTPRAMHAGVVSRIKVMSGLDIAEHRVPQDGRCKIRVKGKEVDFRISVLPSYFGEKVVLRVLDKNQTALDLSKLGFESSPLAALTKAAEHPHGMIVICGPTGSGKTTTLYAIMKLVDSPQKNLVTVEDPVEFQMDGVNQVAVRPEVRLTFAAALRSILRQDPNVIMVGEIRDSETADVAVKAALTGHLVLTTLHATTAAGAVTRFVNMGIEPFLITSTVLLAGSQRLVRKICTNCREPYEPGRELIKQLGIPKKTLEQQKKLVFYRPKGCDVCAHRGYSGRVVLLEALLMTPRIKELILRHAQEYELKKAGREEGMLSLRENGIAKIIRGVTSPEEVMRVTVRDEDAEEPPK